MCRVFWFRFLAIMSWLIPASLIVSNFLLYSSSSHEYDVRVAMMWAFLRVACYLVGLTLALTASLNAKMVGNEHVLVPSIVGIAANSVFLFTQLVPHITKLLPIALIRPYLSPGGYELQELFVVAILAILLLVTSIANTSLKRPVTYLAVISACLGLFNIELIDNAMRRLPFLINVRGDSELRSFTFGLLALFTGYSALLVVRHSHKQKAGLVLAWVGIISGGLWAAYWALLAITMMIGMSLWRG